MKAISTIALVSLMAWMARGDVLRVWSEAPPGGNGSSWATALRDLSSALSQATSGDEIWVAKGIYKPTADGDRAISFALKAGVGMYGGFAGTESERDQRDADPRTNGTVLSGDLDGNDTNTDGNFIAEDPSDVLGLNSYHVVTLFEISGVVVDGFAITAGQAVGAAQHSQGGGMRCERVSDVVLANLLLTGNTAVLGGGLYCYLGDIILTRSALQRNFAGSQGGGLYLISSDGATAQVTLAGNSTDGNGGGILFDEGDLVFIQTILVGNSAAMSGGGIYVSDGHPILSQSVIAGNSAGVMGGRYWRRRNDAAKQHYVAKHSAGSVWRAVSSCRPLPHRGRRSRR